MFRNLMNRWIKKSVATKKTICKPDRLSMLQLEDRVTPTVTFASTTSSSSGGSEPWSVATGDFNNDGKLDLAVANFASSGVAIRLGDGTGGFGAANIYSSGGSGPSFLALGDFNNDGKLDLAVTNLNSNNVAIRLGDGAGGLGTVSTYFSGGGQPWSIAMGDINNDGKLDLVTANYADNNIGILLGNGAGGFNGPITSFTFNTGPRSVAVGDLNNDGKLDLAVTHAVSNNVAVFAGLGNGQFIFISTYSTGGSFPVSVTVNDFNNDGKLDLAVANESSNNVGIRLGNGFTGLTTLSSGGASPFSTAAGDFNNDGKLDLALTNFNSNNVAVSLGNGSGGFSTPSTFSSGGSVPWSVAVGDFNADGKQDLVTVNRSSNSIGVLLNTTTPVASLVATLSSGKLTIIDANGSKNNAITLSVSGSNLVVTDTSGEIFSNTGTNTYTVPLTSITGSITVNSMGGNDTLTVNHSGGVITNPINYNGGVGGFDTLVVTGGSFATGNFVYTGVDSGTIGLTGAGLISYSGLEPIDTTGSTINNLVFTLPAGPSTATLANDGANLKLSASAFEDTTFANPTGSITVNRGNAADTLTIGSSVSNLTATTIIGTNSAPFTGITISGPISLATDKDLEAYATKISVSSAISARNVTLDADTGSQVAGNFKGVNITANVTGSGTVTVVGRGGNSGNSNNGVRVSGGAVVQGTSTSITGIGGASTGLDNDGVSLFDSGSKISSSSGAVLVQGTGGGIGGDTLNNNGVLIDFGAVITSAGTGSGATVTVEGQAGASSLFYSHGVNVVGTGAKITSSGGPVSVIGTGNSSNLAVILQSDGEINSGNNAPITITTDSVDIQFGTIKSGTGTTTIRPRTAATQIILGGSDVLSGSPLTLGLTSTELNKITAGKLVIGRNDIATGQVTVSSAVNPVNATALEVITARNIVVGANLTGGSGGLTLSANQQATATTGNFIGVNISANVTASGSLMIEGLGGDDATGSQFGVRVQSGALTQGSTTTVIGTGGSGSGNSNYGVYVLNANSQITSSGGAVSVTGTGGGSGSSGFNTGVWVDIGGVITSAVMGPGATVTVNGQGGNTTGGGNYGVNVLGSNSQITSSGGAVSVSGTGGGSGTSGNNHGVRLQNGGVITSAGTAATVTVTGQGGNTAGTGGGGNYGVIVFTANSQITSSGGAVSVSGTGGGSGGSTGNYGVYVVNGGVITSAGTAATVTVTGQGGNSTGSGNYGVYVLGSNSQISSLSAPVLLTGTAGNGISVGVRIESSAAVISNAGNPITLTADGVGIISGGSINSGTGTTTIRPRTAGTLINLGGVDVLSGSPLTLGLTDAELDQVVAANLIIGKSDAGSLSVSNSVTRNTATNLQLVTGGDLIVNSSVNTTGGTLSLQAGGTVQPLFTGTEITAATLTFTTGTKLRFAINGATADTHYSVLRVNGAVNLTGAELELHGAYVPGVADDFTLIDNDGTEAIAGTFSGLAEGALVDLNGRSYAISYVGGDGNDAVLSPTITGFDVQRGQTQRSFIRHLDVDLSSNSLATALLGSGRVRLLRYNLDGSGPGVSVNLAGRLSVNGARLSIDFGSGGIGGNRNSNIGDGYYVLEFDLNGDSTYDSDLSFYRLLGDTNGDRTVNTTDVSNIETAISLSQYDPDLDINGDGVVNGIDRTITLRHRGRSIGSSLHLDD
jgi:hypothetical protein